MGGCRQIRKSNASCIGTPKAESFCSARETSRSSQTFKQGVGATQFVGSVREERLVTIKEWEDEIIAMLAEMDITVQKMATKKEMLDAKLDSNNDLMQKIRERISHERTNVQSAFVLNDEMGKKEDLDHMDEQCMLLEEELNEFAAVQDVIKVEDALVPSLNAEHEEEKTQYLEWLQSLRKDQVFYERIVDDSTRIEKLAVLQEQFHKAEIGLCIRGIPCRNGSIILDAESVSERDDLTPEVLPKRQTSSAVDDRPQIDAADGAKAVVVDHVGLFDTVEASHEKPSAGRDEEDERPLTAQEVRSLLARCAERVSSWLETVQEADPDIENRKAEGKSNDAEQLFIDSEPPSVCPVVSKCERFERHMRRIGWARQFDMDHANLVTRVRQSRPRLKELRDFERWSIDVRGKVQR